MTYQFGSVRSAVRCGLLVIFLGTAGLRTDAAAQGAAGAHPLRSARRLPESTIRFPVSGRRVTAEGRATVARLTGSAPIARIGALDSPENEVFGAITDVAVDSIGRIFVLDGRLKVVRVFSADGEFIAAIGRSGKGPGEFQAPKSIAIDSRGRLVVVDVGREAHLFDATGDTVHYLRTEVLAVDPSDMLMRRSMYVEGARYGDSTIVHRLDSDFKVAEEFGVVYQSGDPLVDYQVAQGRIACLPSLDAVVVATSALIGEIRAYHSDGELLWTVDLTGYRPIDYQIFPDGSRQATVPAQGYHRVRSLVADGPAHVIVQVGLDTRQSRKQFDTFASLTSYRIDVRDASITSLGTTLPWIALIHHGMLLSRFDDPFPGMDLYRLTR